MLPGARSRYVIAQWGRAQPPEVVRALGLTQARTPAVATLHSTFKALDAEAFEQASQQWAAAVGCGGGEQQREPSADATGSARIGWQGSTWDPRAAGRGIARRAAGAARRGASGRGAGTNTRGVRTCDETAQGQREAELSVAPALPRPAAAVGALRERVLTAGADGRRALLPACPLPSVPPDPPDPPDPPGRRPLPLRRHSHPAGPSGR